MSAHIRERGKSFHLSLWRVGLRALAFFLLLAFGVLVAFFGGAIIYAEATREHGMRWGFVCGCGSPLFLVGFLIFLGMVVCEASLLLNLLRGEHLLVGENALQFVTRGGAVLVHIPYHNIKRVRIEDVIEQRGMKQIVVRKVLFVVRNEKAADTVISDFSTSFSPGKKTGEYYLEPIFQASPDQIGKALLKRWKEFQSQEPEDDEEDEEEESESE